MTYKKAILIILILLAVTGVVFCVYNKQGNFNREGVLEFYSKHHNTDISEIAIEIAETKEEKQTGLMHRKHLGEEQGMLFLFKNSKKRFFWMKNTSIPLDIIYVNDNQAIVSIYRNTKPFSEKGLSSRNNAKFVVEVNSGYCKKHGIRVGDSITFHKF